MWRRFLLVLLCCLVPLQSIQAAERALAHASGAVNGMVHWHEHELNVPHHHDAHGEADHTSVHYDHSQDSVEHVSDHCVCSAGWLLPPTLSLVVSAPAGHPLPSWADRALPSPVLDKPPRPPHSDTTLPVV